MEKNIGCWFEIPVLDMNRAVAFYEHVFGFKIEVHNLGTEIMGWFPYSKNPNASNAGGSLNYSPNHYKPSADGTLIYLASQKNDLSDELSRVEVAGGKVLMSKKMITEEIGFMGMFLDSEGNRIALHSTG